MNTEMDLADTTTREIQFVGEKQTVEAKALRWLHLLLMLGVCRRKTQLRCPGRNEQALPRGCALAVRYSSR